MFRKWWLSRPSGSKSPAPARQTHGKILVVLQKWLQAFWQPQTSLQRRRNFPAGHRTFELFTSFPSLEGVPAMKLDRPVSDVLIISWNKRPGVYFGDLHIVRHLRKSVFLCPKMISLSSKSFKTDLRNFYGRGLMEINKHKSLHRRKDWRLVLRLWHINRFFWCYFATNYRNKNVLHWKTQSSHYYKPDNKCCWVSMTIRMPVNHTLQDICENNAIIERRDEQVKL